MITTAISTNDSMNTLATNLIEAWNSHDPERVTKFYASDFQGADVAQANPQHGPEGVRRSLAIYWQAFPDLHFTRTATVVQGQQVALFWTACGTHQGHLMNMPPTGRAIEVQGASLLLVVDGKIRQASYIWDMAGLLRSIGLLPEL